MVGGIVYVRGNLAGVSDDVWVMELDSSDLEFLKEGLKDFLSKIGKIHLYTEENCCKNL